MIVLCLVFLSCESKKAEFAISSDIDCIISQLELPEMEIDMSKLVYNRLKSTWTLHDELFSGIASSYYPDSTLKERTGFLNGRKQNESIIYFPNGRLQSKTNYHEGKLHGEKKVWSKASAQVLLAHLNYCSGKVHGVQKKWYVTGELYTHLNINMGKEEGLQRAYRKNGDLYANYEAREGRIFGLKKAALCYGVKEENLQYEK